MLELKCEEKFTMGSTYDYSKEIETTILESIPNEIKSHCSIRKIVRSICNLAKVNPLECCLLTWLLSKSKYEIEKVSMESSTKIVEDEYDQKVLIFILMNAYYVKSFVCEQIELEIDTQITSQIPNFKHMYNKKFNPEKSLKTLSLNDINKIFNEWTCKQNKRSKMDYNNLVDKILYLSKSYNVTVHEDQKDDKLGLPKKKRKLNQYGNEMKSEIESVNEEKSESGQKFGSQKEKNKYTSFRFTNSPENPDFLGPSQEHQAPFKRDEVMDMNHSKRTTRNMLQSININDLIPSQDNLFNSQNSYSNVMGSQQSYRNSIFDSSNNSMLRGSHRNSRSNVNNEMKLKKTDSFEELQ